MYWFYGTKKTFLKKGNGLFTRIKNRQNLNKREIISRLGVDQYYAYAWSRTRNALHSQTPKKQ
jgi:hypothetical protein